MPYCSERREDTRPHRVATLCLVGVAALTLTCGCVSAAGPFEGFAGSWSGRGKVTFQEEKTEALSCTAYYRTKEAGSGLALAIRCASPSYKTEIRSNLSYVNGRLTGEWEERNFNATGDASGEISRVRISLQITCAINGRMIIDHRGSQQSVSISTTGGGLSGVSIGYLRTSAA